MNNTIATKLKIQNKRAQAAIRKAARTAVDPLAINRANAYRQVRELAYDAQWKCDAASLDYQALENVAAWAHVGMLDQHTDDVERAVLRRNATRTRKPTAYEKELAHASVLRSL